MLLYTWLSQNTHTHTHTHTHPRMPKIPPLGIHLSSYAWLSSSHCHLRCKYSRRGNNNIVCIQLATQSLRSTFLGSCVVFSMGFIICVLSQTCDSYPDTIIMARIRAELGLIQLLCMQGMRLQAIDPLNFSTSSLLLKMCIICFTVTL